MKCHGHFFIKYEVNVVFTYTKIDFMSKNVYTSDNVRKFALKKENVKYGKKKYLDNLWGSRKKRTL